MVVCVWYFRVIPGLSLSEDCSLHFSCDAVCIINLSGCSGVMSCHLKCRDAIVKHWNVFFS